MSRNLSINTWVRGLAARHEPRYRFAGESPDDWRAWREQLLPAVRQTLGRVPERVPLRPEVQTEWRDGGLIKQRVIFDVYSVMSGCSSRPTERAC